MNFQFRKLEKIHGKYLIKYIDNRGEHVEKYFWNINAFSSLGFKPIDISSYNFLAYL